MEWSTTSAIARSIRQKMLSGKLLNFSQVRMGMQDHIGMQGLTVQSLLLQTRGNFDRLKNMNEIFILILLNLHSL